MKIERNKKYIPIKKNFFFIYEGSCTEPDYFRGLKRNMAYLGIDKSLLTLYEIPKLSLDSNETNILNMLDIAQDYILYNKAGVWTVRYLTTVVFEAVVKRLSWSNSEYNMIRGDNKALLDFRSSLEYELCHSQYVSDGIVVDFEHAVDLVSEMIQHKLKCRINCI